MPPGFFVDENDLALGKRLSQVHSGVLYPGHPDLPEVPRGSVDDAWLPAIGVRGLVVITRDQRIRYRPVEKRMWVEHGVRGFVLTGRKSQSTTDSFTILERHWVSIETVADERSPGPWMYAVTWEQLRENDLSD